MNMSFRKLGIKFSYTGKGKDILKEFLLPTLAVSKSYDRITSFYSVESLLSISQGISSIYEKQGKIRLVIGIQSFPKEFIDVSLQQKLFRQQIAKIRKEISEKIVTIEDSLEKERLATIAWMIEDGLMEVKAAGTGQGIFHAKTLIFTDETGEKIAAIGSPNETRAGLGGNFEQLLVVNTWGTAEAVKGQVEFFDSLWNNKIEGVYVSDISKDTADMILDALGDEYNKTKSECNGIIRSKDIIKESALMPTNFFVSGDIPALYMHQERAVIDALSRWPVRVLFADEVGLGKTFEAAATMVFLVKYCGVKRVIILTPKSVLQQWQEELHDHFDLDIWRYDSGNKEYISYDGRIKSMKGKNPIGPSSPDLILMSAQFARGTGENRSIFDRKDSVLPDLLVIDEAHSARVSKALDGSRKKTRMYKMVEAVARQIPHIILATATPMQKNAEEYHAMLKILGLPKAWTKERNFALSLKVIASDSDPDISDAGSIAALLRSIVVNMRPDLSRLEAEEKDAIAELMNLFTSTDKYDIACHVQDNWEIYKKVLIKMHPARLLTVRNTRRALTEVGYVFPKRNLIEKNIASSDEMLLFYDRVNRYISTESFSVERALSPDKKFNVGFIRINYQQRVASSLYSCKASLERRFEKMRALRKLLTEKGIIQRQRITDLHFELPIDDIDDDEVLLNNVEAFDFGEIGPDVDWDQLRLSVNLECTSLSGLIDQAEKLLQKSEDRKISTSIMLGLDCLDKQETVLLFSRYTDTIDALIDEFKRHGGADKYTYGIYTGKQSVIVKHGREFPCDKGTIKAELFSKKIRIMFCSDAASEGLNLQAARILINVDVPWTPARLEQRIGRIARLGQTAAEVDIYNVWYPNSVEARMYHRIQKRLEETNLAIGEFPDVIATDIKNAVIEGREVDDSGLKELMEIRNSYQTKALGELWSNRENRVTTSGIIRKRLLQLCNSRYQVIGTSLQGIIKHYLMPDGAEVELTDAAGMSESISLKSPPFMIDRYHVPNLYIKTDTAGKYISFLYGCSDAHMIRHENVFELIDGELTEEMISEKHPRMLANMNRLDLEYSVDCELDQKPVFWPEKGK